MRQSHCQRILQLEKERHRRTYGRTARITQLKYVTLVLLVLFAWMSYSNWRHPRPVSHVWIDDVLVEVLEDSWADTVREVLLWLWIGCGSVLAAMLLCTTPQQQTRSSTGESSASLWSSQQQQQQSSRKSAKDSYSAFDEGPSIAPTGQRRPAAQDTTALPGAGRHGSSLDGSVPVRHPTALDEFLTRVSRQWEPKKSTWGDNAAMGGGSAAAAAASSSSSSRPFSASGLNFNSGAAMASDGAIRVDYNGGGGGAPAAGGLSFDVSTRAGGGSGSAALTDADWHALGIYHVDAAVQRAREFLSEVCNKVVSEVEQSDRWLGERQLHAYDCSHSLQEVLVAPAASAPAVSTGWGAAPVSSVPQTITKVSALLQEKQRIQQSAGQDFDTVLRIDQRIALEGRLDVSSTFPQTTPLSNTDLTARQQYILRRLRTFAKQKTLASYKHNGGDAEMWRAGFPCDAHLLLHVLRTAVEGMPHYVRFGFQSASTADDLCICVGDTGEPYFYVRHRTPAVERLYATKTGPNSLMEALVVFAAVVQVFHQGVYGGIRGTMDLKRAGMSKLLKDRRGGMGMMMN